MIATGSQSGGGGGGGATGPVYTLNTVSRTYRVNPDQTTTQIVNITATSNLYGVVFTFTILATTFDQSGGPPAISLKTAEVDQICGHPQVQDFRTETDQGVSQVLYNFAVITVGDAAQAYTSEVRVRMDMIGLPSAFAAIDNEWNLLVAMGAS